MRLKQSPLSGGYGDEYATLRRYLLSESGMFTHAVVLKTLIVYLFIKATIFAPLAVVGFISWWSDRQSQRESDSGELNALS
jgi:hypothetical protein